MSVPAPACTKCRVHRARCDRTRPVCNRCSRLGYPCAYPVRNPATAFVNYVIELESQVVQLEQTLREIQQNQHQHQHQHQRANHELAERRSPPVPARGADEWAHGPRGNSGPISSPTMSEYLITDLFANSEPLLGELAASRVKNLVVGLAQVSLSAMTAPGDDSGTGPDGASHDAILHTLILSAAFPPSVTGGQSVPSLALPHIDIAEKVCERYCADLLPEFPCLASHDVRTHLRRAYGEPGPEDRDPGLDPDPDSERTRHDRCYSVFVVATILATTAITLAPSSSANAAALFFSGIRFLESALVSEHRRKNLGDPLRDIEIAVLLGAFGLLLADIEGSGGGGGDGGSAEDNDRRVDAWALSGIAVRIAVDLGLHKACYSDHQQRLFWTAYILDRKCAVASRRPVGLPEAGIDTRPTDAAAREWGALELYWIMSDAYTADLAGLPAPAASIDAAASRFSRWADSYCAARQPSRVLVLDMNRVRTLLGLRHHENA